MLAGLVRDLRVAVLGAMYDGGTRGLQLLPEEATTDARSGE